MGIIVGKCYESVPNQALLPSANLAFEEKNVLTRRYLYLTLSYPSQRFARYPLQTHGHRYHGHAANLSHYGRLDLRRRAEGKNYEQLTIAN